MPLHGKQLVEQWAAALEALLDAERPGGSRWTVTGVASLTGISRATLHAILAGERDGMEGPTLRGLLRLRTHGVVSVAGVAPVAVLGSPLPHQREIGEQPGTGSGPAEIGAQRSKATAAVGLLDRRPAGTPSEAHLAPDEQVDGSLKSERGVKMIAEELRAALSETIERADASCAHCSMLATYLERLALRFAKRRWPNGQIAELADEARAALRPKEGP